MSPRYQINLTLNEIQATNLTDYARRAGVQPARAAVLLMLAGLACDADAAEKSSRKAVRRGK